MDGKAGCRYVLGMALVRILVDGYSLLHSWPELAPGRSRFCAAAREELIQRLTLYQDAVKTPLTIVFDGANNDIRLSAVESTPELEILYSRTGQTADQIIERLAYRFKPYGEILAVTDDFAERDTVIAMGGLASSCLGFIQSVENALGELEDDIKTHNLREKNRFRSSKNG